MQNGLIMATVIQTMLRRLPANHLVHSITFVHNYCTVSSDWRSLDSYVVVVQSVSLDRSNHLQVFIVGYRLLGLYLAPLVRMLVAMQDTPPLRPVSPFSSVIVAIEEFQSN